MFFVVDLCSTKAIKSVLNEFTTLSGLVANPSTSTILCSGVPLGLKQHILDRFQMKKVTLPITNLVVVVVWMKTKR